MCHAREPLWPNIIVAPKGVYLETADDILRHRHLIMTQAVLSHAMPPNNLTAIEAEERQALYEWLVAAKEQATSSLGIGQVPSSPLRGLSPILRTGEGSFLSSAIAQVEPAQ
jgi:hypothetical protein